MTKKVTVGWVRANIARYHKIGCHITIVADRKLTRPDDYGLLKCVHGVNFYTPYATRPHNVKPVDWMLDKLKHYTDRKHCIFGY